MAVVDKQVTPPSQPHLKRHTVREEKQIKNSFKKHFRRYDWNGVYGDLLRKGYKQSYSRMIYACKRMGLVELKNSKKKSRILRRYPELLTPGEKFRLM